jgi:peptidyl-prolyl cis-trans isomerase B (cyclophilin B)
MDAYVQEKKAVSIPHVTIHTTFGPIRIELYAEQAPLTVKNFLRYVDDHFYAHTIFHRVIENFMIQGGGFTLDLVQKKGYAAIQNEADNRLSNERGTMAMARTQDLHSATSQFFINVVDNKFLDHKTPTQGGFGYCVFGKVVGGMEIIDKISQTKTTVKKGMKDVPVETIEILDIVRNVEKE